MKFILFVLAVISATFLSGCASSGPVAAGSKYNLVIRNGTIYDGSGKPPFHGDVAISGNKIAAVGSVPSGSGKREIDVQGRAVAPGFINMLSWSNESLIQDGRSQGEIRQG